MIEREDSQGQRLQKVLARTGFGSRRACEELIRQGRVTVNSAVVVEMGTRVGPDDAVAVDGKPVQNVEKKTYIMLHKPPDHVTTTKDPHGRPTVLDLVPEGRRLFPVGRLDADSEGLLLLTDDGELTYRLTHPRFSVPKEYRVLASGCADGSVVHRLRTGVELDGRLTAPARVSVLDASADHAWLRFVIHEGRKRQIRRMCEAVDLRVRRLIRTRFGPLRLGKLLPGSSRPLTEREIGALRRAAGISDRQLAIAIDGPAGSGKSVLAALLAKRHNLLFLDTGAMYRAVTLLALRRGIDPDDEAAVSDLAEQGGIEIVPPLKADGREYTVLVDGKDVTWDVFQPEVGRSVSVVAAFPRVREALVRRQREIASRSGAVIVGRDIGTVVVPEAEIKIYLDASDRVRARRRQTQLRERGIEVPFDEVLNEIQTRDKLDSERAMSPLAIAPDAIVVNTDRLSVDEEASLVEGLLQQRGLGG